MASSAISAAAVNSDATRPLSGEWLKPKFGVPRDESLLNPTNAQTPKTRLLNGLLKPVLQPHAERVAGRREARDLMKAGMAAARAGNRTLATKRWMEAVALCKRHGNCLDAQLSKFAKQQGSHAVEELFKLKHDDVLLVIAPSLHKTIYGALRFVSSDWFYLGEVNSDKKRHGNGACFTSDGHSWRGQWANGYLNGQGEYYFAGRPTFRGVYKKSNMCGPGAWTFPDGSVLTGNWTNNIITKGEYKSSKGWRFEGPMEDKLPHGCGTFFWQHSHLSGAARNGVPHCLKGVYVFGGSDPLAGFAFHGPWVNGKRHGPGVLVNVETGRRHFCEYQDDALVTTTLRL